MWRRRTILALTASIGVFSGSALAAEPSGPKDGKPAEKPKQAARDDNDKKSSNKALKAPTTQVKDGLTGEYAIMAEELALSDAQKNQLIEKIAAKEAAIKAWTDKNRARQAELKRSADDAQTNKNADKAKEFNTALRQLESERDAVISKADAEIDAVLTPDQLQKWEGIRAFRAVSARLKKVELTDAQTQEIKARCVAASTALATSDRKARMAAMQSLMNSIDKEVLTDAQRDKLGLGRGDKGKQHASPKHK